MNARFLAFGLIACASGAAVYFVGDGDAVQPTQPSMSAPGADPVVPVERRAALPPLRGTTGAPDRPLADAPPVSDADRIRQLEAKIDALTQLVAAQAAAGTSPVAPGVALVSPQPVGVAPVSGVTGQPNAPGQTLYPAPHILPGTENRPGGPILAAFGPPPPYNTGMRPSRPGASAAPDCATCGR
ncbi:MAG: hypothetical protein ACOYM9_24240 [Bradymonadia bacterium]